MQQEEQQTPEVEPRQRTVGQAEARNERLELQQRTMGATLSNVSSGSPQRIRRQLHSSNGDRRMSLETATEQCSSAASKSRIEDRAAEPAMSRPKLQQKNGGRSGTSTPQEGFKDRRMEGLGAARLGTSTERGSKKKRITEARSAASRSRTGVTEARSDANWSGGIEKIRAQSDSKQDRQNMTEWGFDRRTRRGVVEVEVMSESGQRDGLQVGRRKNGAEPGSRI